MDDWSFMNEVDVISKWPQEHKKSVFEGGKWSERRDGLEALNKLIEANPRLSTETMTIYGELMDELRKILDRETNIVVVTTAAKTVELLAKGLRTKFGGFVGMVFPFLIKRAKDKKKNVRDAVSSSLNSVAETTTSERILKDIVDWFSIPSPESKQTLLEFLYKYFIKMINIDIPFIKAIVPSIVKCASESDVNVREKACMAIGSLRRLMGEAISPFIGSIVTDQSKMDKISQYEKEAKEEWDKLIEERKAQSVGNENEVGTNDEAGNGGNTQDSSTNVEGNISIDPWTLIDPQDITKKLDKNIETQLVDKAWKERLEGCETLKKEVDAVGRIEISDRLREIMVVLIRIIEKDVNVNVASCAANVLTGIAIKARFSFCGIACKGFPIFFEKLKDKKQILRDALIEVIDAAATTVPFSNYSESVVSAIGNKNPQTRGQTLAFVSRFFSKNDQTTLDIEGLKAIAEVVNKSSNDADKEVRDYNTKCVASIVKCVGEGVAKRMFPEIYEDTSKIEKINGLVEEIEKENGKVASVEMKRLAKQYNIGNTSNSNKKQPPPSASSSSSTTASVPRRPMTSSRPVSNTVRPATSTVKKSTGVTRPATSTVRQPMANARPVTTTVRQPISRPATSATRSQPKPEPLKIAPKPFVARPAPSFAKKPEVRPTTGSSLANRPTTKPVGKPVPIKPNVIRTMPPPNSAGSAIPRPSSISRPPSRSTSKNEMVSRIKPVSRGPSKEQINPV